MERNCIEYIYNYFENKYSEIITSIYEPRFEKTCLRDFRPGPTQTGLCSHRKRLDA